MQMRHRATLYSALLVAFGLCVAGAQAQNAAPAGPTVLKLAGKTELPGYSGDFDHFEVDMKGNRLFLAAEDHNTMEVFELKSGKHLKTIEGFDTPHSILYMPEKNRIIVTQTGGDGYPKVLDAKSYKFIGVIKTPIPGADSFGYDAPRKRLYLVAGGKDRNLKETVLSEVDPGTGKFYGDVKFDTDKVEAIAVEQKGNKIYLNVTGKSSIAIVDKTKRAVVGNWPFKDAGAQNACAAYDEANHRLFIVSRNPGRFVVYNTDTGATLADFKAPERTDQVLWDAANKRIYSLGGEGYIGVYQQKDPDHYVELARVPSFPGAKTGIIVPELNRLIVAESPGEGKNTGAGVLMYDIASAK